MTQTADNGGPAFPIRATDTHDTTPGMTLRDYFAGQALAGFTSTMGEVETPYWDLLARDAYHAADAMLAARVQS